MLHNEAGGHAAQHREMTEAIVSTFGELLEASAALHRHLCPRQVLGVRIGLLGGAMLGLKVPQAERSKRLLAIVETDGCAADGVAVATNCWVGHRTLRVEDFGKVAATFVDCKTQRAIRIAPQRGIRQRAEEYALEARGHWEAQKLGYQRMPDEYLLSVQPVQLTTPLQKIVSRPGRRAECEICGEEIINEREVRHEGTTMCQHCWGAGYYQELERIDGGQSDGDQIELVHK